MKWLLVFAVLAALYMRGVSAASPQVTLSVAEQQMLKDAALDLRDAIVSGNVDKILGHVSRSGLACTDTRYSLKEVSKDLRNHKSYLFLSLFNTTTFSKRCGSGYPPEFPAISEKDFFIADKNSTLEIVPYSQEQAQVIFKSHIEGHYQREWWFKKEGNAWKLAEGFVVGDCTCG